MILLPLCIIRLFHWYSSWGIDLVRVRFGPSPPETAYTYYTRSPAAADGMPIVSSTGSRNDNIEYVHHAHSKTPYIILL